jgi:hypothetical protein
MGDFPGLLTGSDRRMKERLPARLRAAMRLAITSAAVFSVGLCAGSGVQLIAQAGAGPAKPMMLTEPPAPLLPATLGKMKRAAEGDVGDGLDHVETADKTVLAEDGLRRFARSDYTQGAERGNVAVYQFVDASGAISAYDYFLKPGMRREKLGDDSVANEDELLLRSGKNVVVERGKLDRAATAAVMNPLIDHLPKALGTVGIAPLLPTLLPAKGLDADSVKYALGPVGYQAMGGAVPAQEVGFDRSGETVTAKYRNGGVLTLLLYPTPQIAGEQARAVQAAIKLEDAPAGTVMLRREGPLVALTTGEWSAAEAKAMVESVHLHSELSFDKPIPLVFQSEIHKTYTLLESIAIFSGLGALAAVVLGLSLGFGRAAIRVMQGKPAATEPEFLRIDLREAGSRSLRGPRA